MAVFEPSLSSANCRRDARRDFLDNRQRQDSQTFKSRNRRDGIKAKKENEMISATWTQPASEPAPAAIWRWCSGIAFVVEVIIFTFMPNPRRRLSAVDLQAVNKWMFYGIAAIATAAAALQVINFAVWNRFWPFLTVVFVHLF